MSFEGVRRRRCIVQKLDFENCIVTNFKTTARGRKKLRARITREFEHFTDVPKQSQEPLTPSPSSTQAERPSSPVLITKQCRSVGSPAVIKRKKENSPEERIDEVAERSTTEEVYQSPGSPVFKTYKKQKTSSCSLNSSRNFSAGACNPETACSQGSSGSGLHFQIEEFTQESRQSVRISSVESPAVKTDESSFHSGEANAAKVRRSPPSEFTQESKQSVKISSVESPAVKTDESSCCSGEADTTRVRGSPPTECFNAFDHRDSSKSARRNYKKKSLLGRLHKLQQKQASEKLLWQHQNRKNSANSLTVSIVAFWKEEFNYFLKCESPDSETTFLIVDSRWVPNVRNVRRGSVVQVHPPWQKLRAEDSTMTVLLSIICLDVLEETREPVLPQKTPLAVPAGQFEADRKLFIDSLFPSCCSGLLF